MTTTTHRLSALILMAVATLAMTAATNQYATTTERLYLSGTGCDDTVDWDFYCTDGRNSGSWTKIAVPSCWELQGFGTYQYGMRFYGKATPEGIAQEHGLYRTEFTLPAHWQGRQVELVLEGVFTDATVTINGRKAGNGLYQGGFTRHTINVSDRVFFGAKKNRLEVDVAKESANPQVNLAERRADYWNFGGIWRPVFIVAKPMQNISRVAIDARADGRFRADVFLSRAMPGASVSVEVVDGKGRRVATSHRCAVASDQATVDFSVDSPQPWTAETPSLYTAVFTLSDAKGQTLHTERQRFGFRTIEYRHSYNGDEGDGVYINGRKVIFKGVNRHSFRPETGRTLSKAKNLEDVRLIKSMNMNAVRLSHYPADPDFLDACDSLGLYVECELPGWHQPHETIVGSQVVEEMVTRDVNHPSIIFWSNGNEGGFNYDLEPLFRKLDPQQRVVLYPWANRNGFETKHYRSWGETAEYMRQKEIFMPTEFLHGLYDGGHGAGLADYWRLMMQNERCAGGFLWDLMDQAVVRTDQGGLLDCVGNFGADGIVGPHMEREGSYYTIRQVWCPIQIERKGDKLYLANNYDFTNLKACRANYTYLDMPAFGQDGPKTVAEGTLSLPSVAPGATDSIAVPKGSGDVLRLTVTDPHGQELFDWSFNMGGDIHRHSHAEASTSSVAGGFADRVAAGKATTSASRVDAAAMVAEDATTLTISSAGRHYVMSKTDGRLMRVDVDGRTISLANGPRLVAAKRSDRSDDGFYNHDDKQAFQKKTHYTQYADQGSFAGFTFAESKLTANFRHGSMDRVEWTFMADGAVTLDAYYNFNGVVDIFGICFDYPEQLVKSKAWVGNGPYRVWQNRLEGPQYGYWQTEYNDPVPGESWQYPEFKGYFDRVSWMRLTTSEGYIGIEPDTAEHLYLGVYTPRDGRDQLLYDLPPTGLALLKVIPAVRNKVNTTDLNGPSAQPRWMSGKGSMRATLRFE